MAEGRCEAESCSRCQPDVKGVLNDPSAKAFGYHGWPAAVRRPIHLPPEMLENNEAHNWS